MVILILWAIRVKKGQVYYADNYDYWMKCNQKKLTSENWNSYRQAKLLGDMSLL